MLRVVSGELTGLGESLEEVVTGLMLEGLGEYRRLKDSLTGYAPFALTALWLKYYDYLHFKDEETEAERRHKLPSIVHILVAAVGFRPAVMRRGDRLMGGDVHWGPALPKATLAAVGRVGGSGARMETERTWMLWF